MKTDVLLDPYGFFCGIVKCSNDVINENSIPFDDLFNLDETWYYTGDAWKSIGVQSSLHHIIDRVKKAWIDPRTLDQIKDQKWEKIKSQRDAFEFGGFDFEGGIYDSDQVSQGRIMGAALAGVDQVWTLADNTTVSLTALQLQQLYQASQAHIANAHERGRIARQLIYEAETIEQVEAVHF